MGFIINNEHYNQTMEELNRQRGTKAFCDVQLKVEGNVFWAHRNILAACSEYFQKMFSINMREKYNDIISIQSVTSSGFGAVLTYIYTGRIKISASNAAEVLQCASLMMLQDLVEKVGADRSEDLDVTNCIQYLEVARLFSVRSLDDKIYEFMQQNFDEFVQSERFVDIISTDLQKLLSSDKIKVNKEDEVFDCITKWVEAEASKRYQDFPKLFKLVRLQYVNQTYLLSTIKNSKYVKSFVECRDKLDEALHFHIDPSGIDEEQPRDFFSSSDEYEAVGIPVHRGQATQAGYNHVTGWTQPPPKSYCHGRQYARRRGYTDVRQHLEKLRDHWLGSIDLKKPEKIFLNEKESRQQFF